MKCENMGDQEPHLLHAVDDPGERRADLVDPHDVLLRRELLQRREPVLYRL